MRSTVKIALLLALALAVAPAAWGRDSGNLRMRIGPANVGSEPAIFAFDLAPGAEGEEVLSLQNRAEQPLRLRVYATDAFNTPDGALEGTAQGAPARGVGAWTSVSASEVDLAPGQRQTLRVRVAVPPGTPPGEHLGMLFVQPPDPVGRAQGSGPPGIDLSIDLEMRFGTAIVVRVPGPLTPRYDLGPLAKSYRGRKVHLAMPLENTGNTFLKPVVGWTVFDPAGRAVASQEATPTGYLLPGSRLDLALPIATERPLSRGLYRVEVSLEFPLGLGQVAGPESRVVTREIQLP